MLKRGLLSSVGALLWLFVCAVGSVFSYTPFINTDLKFLYGHYTQMGSRGFFGPYNVDASSTGNFASLNGWVGGGGDVGDFSSGSNAAIANMAFQATPGLKYIKSRLSGTYKINVYNVESDPGASVPMSPGEWSKYSIDVSTPLLSLRYGKTDFHFGNHLQFGADRTKEHLVLEWSWGLHWVYEKTQSGWQRKSIYPPTELPTPEDFEAMSNEQKEAVAEEWGFKPLNDEADSIVTSVKDFISPSGYPSVLGTSYTPQMTIGVGFFPWSTPPTQIYFNTSDLSAVRGVNLLAYLWYYATTVEVGLGGTYSRFRIGPESQTVQAKRLAFPPQETVITEGWIFCNYDNGVFFVKTEVDWYNQINTFQRSQTGEFGLGTPGMWQDGSGRSRFAPQYIESWRYMVQLGALTGPLVSRLLYTYIPGPDRRHGIIIDRGNVILDADHSSADVFYPYSMMLGPGYRAGIQSFRGIADASVFAVRFDYAIAANLWVHASFLRAFRNTKGYGWGYIRPEIVAGNPPKVQTAYAVRGSFSEPAPAIPDPDLGWEATVGMRWKLLEDWDITLAVGVWQPGRWFNYACIDKSVPNWDLNLGSANNWGVNPNRTVDRVLGIEMYLGAGI